VLGYIECTQVACLIVVISALIEKSVLSELLVSARAVSLFFFRFVFPVRRFRFFSRFCWPLIILHLPVKLPPRERETIVHMCMCLRLVQSCPVRFSFAFG